MRSHLTSWTSEEFPLSDAESISTVRATRAADAYTKKMAKNKRRAIVCWTIACWMGDINWMVTSTWFVSIKLWVRAWNLSQSGLGFVCFLLIALCDVLIYEFAWKQRKSRVFGRWNIRNALKMTKNQPNGSRTSARWAQWAQHPYPMTEFVRICFLRALVHATGICFPGKLQSRKNSYQIVRTCDKIVRNCDQIVRNCDKIVTK